MKKKRKRIKRKFEDLVRNPYRVMIDGKGKPIQDIVSWYFDQIENGFILTVQDITYLLDCSYDYVLEKVAPYVLHIRITDTIRPYLFQAEPPESWIPLLTKRMLFSHEDLVRFLREQAQYEWKFERFRISEISEIEDWMKVNGFSFAQVKERLTLAFIRLTELMGEEERKKRREKKRLNLLSPRHYHFDEAKWYSTHSIMEEMGFRYRVQAQRFLDGRGVNPIRLGKLVRYVRVEWEEEEVLCYPYSEFLYLQEVHGESFYQVWIQTAMEEWKKSD